MFFIAEAILKRAKALFINEEACMKLKEQYQKTKLKNLCSVILIKSGSFYVTFLEDAIILNYLLKYKVVENRVGFPIKSLDKVIKNLQKNKINYYISENDFQEFADNNYQQTLEKSILYYELSLETLEIYNFLNSNIERKFIKKTISKIKEIIDEG